jgi:hypothetical protein
MRTLIILGAAILLLAAIAAQNANACTDYAHAEALTDSYLPVSSGPYDPCSYWLRWTYKFGRFSANQGTILIFDVLGAPGSHREYLDSDYPPGPLRKFPGMVYVGPSTYNEITISRDGRAGSFNVITADANYYNSDPTRPGGE